MRFIYTVIFYVAIPFVLLRLLWRGLAAPAYTKRWAERFGFIPYLETHKKVIWLHTVSVGEFIAALPLIKQLQQNLQVELVITTTTPTGSDRVRAVLGDSVYHVYAPYDLPDVLARFFTRVNPSLLLIMETELWPNLLQVCVNRNVPSVLVNARMSERSARGYKKLSMLTRPMLSNLSMALVQNKKDAARLNDLGLPLVSTQVTGNIKFDLSITSDLQQKAMTLKQQWSNDGERLVWIAASTHAGEDEVILDAFKRIRNTEQGKSVLLVLVPRHPERFSSVEKMCASQGFKVAKRSCYQWISDVDVVLGDTMGELMQLYGASDIAFVGGSLVANGGHNFIEPATWQLPLLSGKHLFNFSEVSSLLQEAGALTLVNSADELARVVIYLIENKEQRIKSGAAALQVAIDNRGALQKTLVAINTYLH